MANGADNKKKEAEAQKLLNSRLQSAQTILTNYGAKAKEIADIQQKILDGEIKTNAQLTTAINKKRQEVVETRKLAEATRAAAEANEDILDYLDETNKLTAQITKKAQYFGKQGKSNLQTLKSSIKEREKELKRYSKISGIDAQRLSDLKKYIASQKEVLKNIETINSKSPEVGVAYGAAADIADNLQDSLTGIFSSLPGGAAINKAFGFDKISEQVNGGLVSGIDAVGASLAAGKSPMAALQAGMKAFNATVMLNPMVAVVAAIVAAAAAVKGLIKVFDNVSKKAHEIAESAGVTYAQGKLLAKQAMVQVSAFGNQLSLQEDILSVATETASEFGTMSMLSAEQSLNISEIGKSFGYGAKQAAQVNNQFLRMGMNGDAAAEAQRNLAAEAVKAGVNVGMVTKDIADNAADMAKFFGSNVKALTKAAVQAAKMGVSLKTMADVSEGLLRFEDSISAQFEFQALTGRQINLDAARELALRGDIAGATQEVLGAVGSIAEFDDMSFLARKKLAEATGMSVDELQKSLIVQSKLKNLNEDDLATMNALGLSAAELRNMTAEQIQQKIAEKQASDKVAASFDAMKATLVSALLPAAEALMGVFAALSPLLKVIGGSFKLISGVINGILMPIQFVFGIFKGIVGAIGEMLDALGILDPAIAVLGFAFDVIKNTIIAAGVILGTVFLPAILAAGAGAMFAAGNFLASAIGAIFTGLGSIPLGLGIPLAIATVAGLIATVSSYMNDGIISPSGGKGGYGDRVLFGPEGAISFNNKDTIVAGTDLFAQANDAMLAPEGTLKTNNSTPNTSELKIVGLTGDSVTKLSSGIAEKISAVFNNTEDSPKAKNVGITGESIAELSLGISAALAVGMGPAIIAGFTAGIPILSAGMLAAVTMGNMAAIAATLPLQLTTMTAAVIAGSVAAAAATALIPKPVLVLNPILPVFETNPIAAIGNTLGGLFKKVTTPSPENDESTNVTSPSIDTNTGITSPSITSPMEDTSTLENAIINLTTTISEMITGESATTNNDPVVTKLEEVKQALFGLDIRMDGKVVGETIRTSDSFRRR